METNNEPNHESKMSIELRSLQGFQLSFPIERVAAKMPRNIPVGMLATTEECSSVGNHSQASQFPLQLQVQSVVFRLSSRFLPCTAKILAKTLNDPVSRWVLDHLQEASSPSSLEPVPTQATNNEHGHPLP
jgi:hypothetical protein